MERLAVSGGWRPLSGFVLKVLIQLAKGNLVLSGENSVKSRGISNSFEFGNQMFV